MGLTVEPTDPYVVTCEPDFGVIFVGEPRSAAWWRSAPTLPSPASGGGNLSARRRLA